MGSRLRPSSAQRSQDGRSAMKAVSRGGVRMANRAASGTAALKSAAATAAKNTSRRQVLQTTPPVTYHLASAACVELTARQPVKVAAVMSPRSMGMGAAPHSTCSCASLCRRLGSWAEGLASQKGCRAHPASHRARWDLTRPLSPR